MSREDQHKRSSHLARRIWLSCLRLRFRFFQKKRLKQPVIEHIEGKPFVILPGVFNPVIFLTGRFLAGSLTAEMFPRGCRVLDLGTGCGVGAVMAAAWSHQVVASDLNLKAVRCAGINVILNDVDERVEIRHGDLFQAVEGETFDRIIFNPPYFPGSPNGDLEMALKSPDMAQRFSAQLSQHLAPEGVAYLVLSSAGVEDSFLGQLEANGLKVDLIRSKELFNETLRLYQIVDKLPQARGRKTGSPS